MTKKNPIHATGSDTQRRGPWHFITHSFRRRPDGRYLVANSRRHRKGLRAHSVSDLESAARPPSVHANAFRHLWAPRRLAWWIAILFAIGGALFALGGVGATWPGDAPAPLREPSNLNWIFIVGAVFFTGAAWLQWLEALNGDVAEALSDGAQQSWRWFGWRPRNLGYLASAVQLVGTVMFNFNTADAMIAGLSWKAEDLLIWTPNMLGCVCFLVSSYLAYAEVSQGAASFAPRSAAQRFVVDRRGESAGLGGVPDLGSLQHRRSRARRAGLALLGELLHRRRGRVLLHRGVPDDSRAL